MESTGIYWKSPSAALAQIGVRALVVNARHVKQVPGCKTDVCDAQLLAIVARADLLRGGFVPPLNFRRLRLLSRRMRKLTGVLAGEKNRLHKVLTDGGVRLGVVVSAIHGIGPRSGSGVVMSPAQGIFHGNHEERNVAIVSAYATGAYSYREIAEHFNVHLATVGRIVRNAMQQCEN